MVVPVPVPALRQQTVLPVRVCNKVRTRRLVGEAMDMMSSLFQFQLEPNYSILSSVVNYLVPRAYVDGAQYYYQRNLK